MPIYNLLEMTMLAPQTATIRNFLVNISIFVKKTYKQIYIDHIFFVKTI